MGRNNTSTVAGASLFLAVTGILGRGTGFLREIIFAGLFGLNRDFDIYLVGAVLPVIINTAVFFLAQNFFIPAYHKTSQEGVQESLRFFNVSFRNFTLFSLLISLALLGGSSPIIDAYLWSSSPSVLAAAENIFLLYIATIPLNAAYGILFSFLQAERKFKHPALSQLTVNIIVIFFVVFFSKSWGIYSIPVGYLAANLMQLIYLLVICRKELNMSMMMSGKERRVRTGYVIWIIVLIELVNQLHIFIDRYFYNFVEEGGIASLNYAMMIYSLPISIFSMAVSTAVFPELSSYFTSKSYDKLESHYNRSLNIIVLIFIPITLIFYFMGNQIIHVLYQRGEFRPEDTYITAGVLKMYSISMVFYAAYSIINKMLYSTGLIKQLLIFSVLIIGIKVAVNFVLVKHYYQYGLAFSTSVSYILMTLSCYFLINYKLKFAGKTVLLKYILFYGAAGLTVFLTSDLLMSIMKMPALAEAICAALISVALYIITLRLFHTDALNTLELNFRRIFASFPDLFKKS